ncbi:MAG: hypothetical protein ACRDJ9_09435 [Dehalococcoidia bacterium]
MAAASAAAAVLAAFLLVGTAAADPPTTPRPADSCTAQMTIMPNPLLGGRPTEAFATVTGLEPGAPYNVFLGTELTSNGVADLDGTAHVTLLLNPLVSVAINVQVATTTRCAVGTLVVGAPLHVECASFVNAGLSQICFR